MMTADDLKGMIVPIVTPLTMDDKVDYEGLRSVTRHVLSGGVHAIFVLGGTGNFCSFTAEERFEITRTVVEEVNGRVPVLAGCMDSSTRLVIKNLKDAARAGADAAVVEPPFYYPSTNPEVITHFTDLAEASPIPLIIYNIPAANKTVIDIHLTRKLAAIPNIIGMKDSTSDFNYFQDLLTSFSGSPFKIIQGQETLAGQSFLLGADGGIIATGNVAPHLVVELYEAGKAGDTDKVRELQARLISIFSICRNYEGDSGPTSYYTATVGSFFRGLHCAMNILGICQNLMTTPFDPPTQADFDRVRAKLVENGLVPVAA